MTLSERIAEPARLQLSRRKGFDLQKASLALNGLPAVNIARPGKLGNPFTIKAAIESEYATESTAQAFVVECFSDWLGPSQSGRDWWQGPESDKRRSAIFECLPAIRGKNLGCWCRPGTPCHADVLLRLANGRARLLHDRIKKELPDET